MSNKNLNIRYIFYFFTSFLLMIIFFNFLKEKEFNEVLEHYKNFVKNEYDKHYNQYKNISELIYFNEFVKEKKLLDILKNNNSNIEEELTHGFENSFLFYKTLGVTDISFYSFNSRQILSMTEKPEDNFVFKLVKEVIKNKKDLINYEIVSDKMYLIFSKPIFDEHLNLIAVINIEFDIDNLVEKLKQNSDFEYRILFSNNLKLSENFFFNMTNEQKKHLINSLSNKNETTLVVKKGLIKYPMIFLPLYESSFYKNNIYLLAYSTNKNNQISKMNENYNFLFIFCLFLISIMIYLIYKHQKLKIEKNIIDKNHKDLFSYVDNYVAMVETNLKGNIVFGTKPFFKNSGYSKDELLGKNINILKHPDMADGFFEKLWEDLKKNNLWKGEIKNIDKNGNSYWIKAVIFPKYNIKNELVGYGSIRTNITDTKQLEKINKLLKEDLSNKLNEIKIKDKTLINATKVQLMSKILDSLSHQWKEPISKISFELSNLNKFTQNNDELLGIEKNIESEIKNLSDMLNEIKNIFNEKEDEKSDLLTVVQECIKSLKKELENKNIKIKFNIKNETFIKITKEELKNIIINIIKISIEQSKINNKKDETLILISAIDENIDKNSDVVIKIEDNIRVKNNSFSNENIDNYLSLSKLFIQKNSGLFWCENNQFHTNYYIKLFKEV